MHRYPLTAVIRQVTMVVVSWFVLAPMIAAQEPLAPPAKVAKSDEPVVDETPETPKQIDVERKQQKRSITLFATIMAGGGIGVLIIGAIAMNTMWARRLRRLARDPGPRQTTVGNDFWFLKPPKQTANPEDPSHRQPPTPPASRDS